MRNVRLRSDMKIIKKGVTPEAVVYRADCPRCATIFEFSQSEGKFTDDQRDGAYVTIDCPVCSHTCTVSYISPQTYAKQLQAKMIPQHIEWNEQIRTASK